MTITLDSDAQHYLGVRRRAAGSPDAARDVAAMRDEERRLRGRYGHGPAMHSEQELPASGAVPRRIRLEPVAEPVGTLVYFHGGGWVLGEPEDYLPICRALAADSGWRVIVADYRKAPEHPFPAAFDDARAAVDDALARHGAAGLPVAVGGDSAGGNLAAAVAHDLRAERPGRLAAQVLITPVLDDDLDTASYLDPDRQLLLDRSLMRWFWDAYAPERCADPRRTPLRSETFAGLPPTVFVSVHSDVLWTEGERYLARLRCAGVPVRHREFRGQLHGFFGLHAVMPAALEAVAGIANDLTTLTHADPHRSDQRGSQR